MLSTIAKIEASLEPLNLAKWKRQNAVIGGERKTRIKWEVLNRPALIRIFKEAIAAHEDINNFEQKVAAVSNQRLVNWLKSQLPDESISTVWESMCEMHPPLKNLENDNPKAAKLMEQALRVIDVRSARNAAGLWADLSDDWRRWLWGRLTADQQDLMRKARGLFTKEELNDFLEVAAFMPPDVVEAEYWKMEDAQRQQVYRHLPEEVRSLIKQTAARR